MSHKIKYELDNIGNCSTICPHGQVVGSSDMMVGSFNCYHCQYFAKAVDGRTIECNYDKHLK